MSTEIILDDLHESANEYECIEKQLCDILQFGRQFVSGLSRARITLPLYFPINLLRLAFLGFCNRDA